VQHSRTYNIHTKKYYTNTKIHGYKKHHFASLVLVTALLHFFEAKFCFYGTLPSCLKCSYFSPKYWCCLYFIFCFFDAYYTVYFFL